MRPSHGRSRRFDPYCAHPEVLIRNPLFQLAAAAGFCLAGTACATPSSGARRFFLPSYLFGTLEQRDFDTRDLCHGRVTEMEFASTPSTVALSVVTLGVYTPHELWLRCEGGALPPPRH